VAQLTLTRVISHLHTVAGAESDADETDRGLLARFARTGGAAAFEALVRRHGQRVLAACRRILTDPADVDDAFQATFLVLLKKTGSVNWGESLGGWLCATAYRVALRARANAERRRDREIAAGRRRTNETPPADLSWREACAILYEELDKLPTRYRAVLLLCYLDGQSRDEAAKNLGCSTGTVRGCLERGRRMLANRLSRRGIAPAVALLAAASGESATAGGLSPALVQSAVRAAAGGASPAVAALVRGVSPMTITSKVKIATVLVLVALIGTGIGFRVQKTGADEKRPAKQRETPTAKDDPPVQAAEVESTVGGRVADHEGKPVVGAKVYWFDWMHPSLRPTQRATTDRDGRFSFRVRHPAFEGVPMKKATAGAYGFPFVTADGFGPGWGLNTSGGPAEYPIVVSPDTVPLRGKVIDLEGRPIAGVRVSVRGLSAPQGGKDLSAWLASMRNPDPDRPEVYLYQLPDFELLAECGMLPQTVTDKDGRFELRGVGQDRVAIVRFDGDSVVTQDADVVNRPIERFTVRERDNSHHNHTYYGSPCTVAAAPSYPITGVITDKDTGKPIAGAKIDIDQMTRPSGQFMRSLTFTSYANGRYRLTGLPKNWKPLGYPQVRVRPPDGESYPETARDLPMSDGTAPTPFNIEMKRGIPLTVKVIDKQTGRPVHAHCEYYPHRDNEFVVQYPGNLLNDPLKVETAAESKHVALPGRGIVTATVYDGPYPFGVVPDALADSVSGGYFNTARASFPPEYFNTAAEVKIQPGAKSAEVTIALDPGLSVPGKIIGPDGEGLAGSEVRGYNPKVWSFAPMSSASFEIRGMKPGEKRRVIAVHKEKKLAGSAVVVAGQKDVATVKLEPWGEAFGRLVDESGKPVSDGVAIAGDDGARYGDLSLGASPLVPANTTIAVRTDGRFRFRGLIPGLKFKIFVHRSKNGREVAKQEFEIVTKSGEVKDLGDFVLKPVSKE
jgi:RNA polymerase sigma factor (sigma-70 family)